MAQKPRVDSVGALESDAPAESTAIETQAAPAPPEAAQVPDRRRVAAYDKETGKQLPHLVPPSHLDGRFPNIVSAPPSTEGK